MGEIEGKYVNFPIELLHDFIGNTKQCLGRIADVGRYYLALKLEFVDEELSHEKQMIKKMTDAGDFLGIVASNYSKAYKNAISEICELGNNPPMVGISVVIWWDFYKNEKSEFEKIVLLAYLALKSILQRKPYVKLSNKFWFSRMAGLRKAHEIEDLPPIISKYASDYQTRKIKKILVHQWYLVTYSRYTRGFYVSLSLNLNQLVLVAEKRRKSTKDKQLKQAQDRAVREALISLGVSRV